MGKVPVVMVPMSAITSPGMVEEQGKEEPLLSLSHEPNFNPLRYLKIHHELKREENEWIEAIIGEKILRIWGAPLKRYKEQRFDVHSFRDILSKHRVAPVVIGEKIHLFRWDDLARSFGWNNLIDYMWENHKINAYFDGGWPRGRIEALESRKRTNRRRMSGMPEDNDGRPTLLDLLLSGEQMEDRKMPNGSNDNEKKGTNEGIIRRKKNKRETD